MKASKFYKIGPVVIPPPPGDIMRFAINVSGDPGAITITRPINKFGKKFLVNMEGDDGWASASLAKSLMDTLFYSDGCGNNVRYKSGVAVNKGFGIEGDEGYNPDYMQEPEMRSLINGGWDIINHGFDHYPEPSSLEDTVTLDNFCLLRVGYQMRLTSIPTNFVGYAQAAHDIGYVAATSEGADPLDGFTPVIYSKMVNTPTLPIFNVLTRWTYDEYQNGTDHLKEQIDLVASEYPNRDMFRLSTHSDFSKVGSFAGFTDFMNHIKNTLGDDVLMCSSREMLEYREMALMPITHTYADGVITIEVDVSGLSDKNRWRDMCFNINSNAVITGVSPILDVESATFNPTTNLVNIFKQKKNW